LIKNGILTKDCFTEKLKEGSTDSFSVKMNELVVELNRLLVKLEDVDKIERKKSIEKLKLLVEEKFPDTSITGDHDEDLLDLWQNKLCRPLLR